jgi:hypothetical protein
MVLPSRLGCLLRPYHPEVKYRPTSELLNGDVEMPQNLIDFLFYIGIDAILIQGDLVQPFYGPCEALFALRWKLGAMWVPLAIPRYLISVLSRLWCEPGFWVVFLSYNVMNAIRIQVDLVKPFYEPCKTLCVLIWNLRADWAPLADLKYLKIVLLCLLSKPRILFDFLHLNVTDDIRFQGDLVKPFHEPFKALFILIWNVGAM